ncbi:uncharacterized protein [Onthophagus taurus]|uniref:uncharacterized protein n=1 Tax=Onthophagus taurus TaxID=166361 RepID=UPI000C1FFCC3|nr:uncharacterized protein LOC111426635 [Onthophagus taurus]
MGALGEKKKLSTTRNKQRANMSFFLVVIFFAVFGIIVFTEIFLIDERGRGAGVLVRHGSIPYHRKNHERPDYEDVMQSDDYISVRMGMGGPLDETVGSLLIGRHNGPVPFFQAPNNQEQQAINEQQLPPYPVNVTPSEGSWQTVNGTRFKFFVYSAYFDGRKDQRSVRIIAATKTRGATRVWCRLWYKSQEGNSTGFISKTIASKLKVIRENWNLKYSACFLLCPLDKDHQIPSAVSIVSRIWNSPSNLLTVMNNRNDTHRTGTTTNGGITLNVCVKPLHFEYNKAVPLLEFIELHRILGAGHFTFYNHTVGPQVACLLERYVAEGVVTLLPWDLNMASQKDIRTEGLFAALNDCLYRSMYRFSHAIMIDLDEFIIPRHNDTIPHLLEWLGEKINSKLTGSYSFQNGFFYLQWEDDNTLYNKDIIASSLLTLKKTRRKYKLHPHKQRSKYICRPEFVVETGNHFIWEFLPGHNTFNVPSDAAILHHYRVCEFGGDDCVQTASVVDRTTFKYTDRLIKSVRGLYDRYKDSCLLQELQWSYSWR